MIMASLHDSLHFQGRDEVQWRQELIRWCDLGTSPLKNWRFFDRWTKEEEYGPTRGRGTAAYSAPWASNLHLWRNRKLERWRKSAPERQESSTFDLEALETDLSIWKTTIASMSPITEREDKMMESISSSKLRPWKKYSVCCLVSILRCIHC